MIQMFIIVLIQWNNKTYQNYNLKSINLINLNQANYNKTNKIYKIDNKDMNKIYKNKIYLIKFS